MENASKALIIAGAILISILIVGLGVIIYNNVSGIASGTGLDSQEISAHNSPFEGYFGDYVSGSNLKALLTQVQANNSAANRNGEIVGNYIYVIDGDNGGILSSSTVKTGKMYKVDYANNEDYSDENGADSSGAPNTTQTKDSPAYWSNGFARTIVVYENKGSTSNP